MSAELDSFDAAPPDLCGRAVRAVLERLRSEAVRLRINAVLQAGEMTLGEIAGAATLSPAALAIAAGAEIRRLQLLPPAVDDARNSIRLPMKEPA